jgi:transposase-like protein
MGPEVRHGEAEIHARVQDEAVRLIKERGVSYNQASVDLGVHQSQLRGWVKSFGDDPQHAFPGQGQMKPEQLEIAQLKREVIKLKAERDILKKAAAYFAKEIDVKFGFIVKHRGIWPANWMCEALGVSRGGFYAWLTRPRNRIRPFILVTSFSLV